MKLQSFGTSAEGRTQWMAIVSSPENLANLDRYRDISRPGSRRRPNRRTGGRPGA
ncbi:hypothetical protein V8F63_13230 [Brevundimonas sp. LF-1]|uniref:hypothetical protein n=1 Tax=Brevundimonas sp. LF-1 TaxID=3126100 RepID=UPI0030E33470